MIVHIRVYLMKTQTAITSSLAEASFFLRCFFSVSSDVSRWRLMTVFVYDLFVVQYYVTVGFAFAWLVLYLFVDVVSNARQCLSRPRHHSLSTRSWEMLLLLLCWCARQS